MCIANCDKNGDDTAAVLQCPVCGFGSVPEGFVVPESVAKMRAITAVLLATASSVERLVYEVESEEELATRTRELLDYCSTQVNLSLA